jgi:hypothetical protein
VASRRHVLVVASRTAVADELRDALLERAQTGPLEVTLLVPAPSWAAEAAGLIRNAVERLRRAGLDVAGLLGEADPYGAVEQVWDPAEYDEIVISTLAPDRSHWLRLEVPARVADLTGVPVATVVAASAL